MTVIPLLGYGQNLESDSVVVSYKEVVNSYNVMKECLKIEAQIDSLQKELHNKKILLEQESEQLRKERNANYVIRQISDKHKENYELIQQAVNSKRLMFLFGGGVETNLGLDYFSGRVKGGILFNQKNLIDIGIGANTNKNLLFGGSYMRVIGN